MKLILAAMLAITSGCILDDGALELRDTAILARLPKSDKGLACVFGSANDGGVVAIEYECDIDQISSLGVSSGFQIGPGSGRTDIFLDATIRFDREDGMYLGLWVRFLDTDWTNGWSVGVRF